MRVLITCLYVVRRRSCIYNMIWPLGTRKLIVCLLKWMDVMITLRLITALSCGLVRRATGAYWKLPSVARALPLPCTCTHSHTPAVARARAAKNLKSSMNTEADRPIIRCTLRSASPPLRGSRCENPVAFAQAGSMTWPNSKRRCLRQERGRTDL